MWSYPRPPRVEVCHETLEVRLGQAVVARCAPGRALRVLETASPPSYYLPLADIVPGTLIPSFGQSTCLYKGQARYYAVRAGDREVEQAAWSHPEPYEGYETLVDHVAFFPGRVDCFVDGEQAGAQEGGFYGGWVTSKVVGPFKGAPGTGHW